MYKGDAITLALGPDMVGRIGRARTSHAGDREFGSQSCQTKSTNKIDICHILALRLALIRKGKDWLAQW